MTDAVIASGIFSITFGLMVFRPRGIKEGVAGALGALMMILAGLVSYKDIIDVLRDTGGILVMLLAMMIISIIVDEAGFFHWAANHSVRLAKGNGRRLFLNTFIMGTIITTIISNDATALIITPIVFSFVSLLGINPIPFLLACTFIADTASLSLPVSNLTNLLVYHQMELSFIPYILAMALPTLVAIVINYLVFYLIFKKEIPINYVEAISEDNPIKHKGFFWVSTIGLFLIVIGYVIGSWLNVPLVYIALIGASLLMLAGRYFKQIEEKQILSQVSWSVLIFVVGMFIVVRGIQNTGLPQLVGNLIIKQSDGSLLKAILYTAGGTALGSNVINNVPMDMMMISVLRSVPIEGWTTPLAYSTILGAGLGPNLTIIGSLATMLWLGTIRRKGVNITPWQYMKVGLLTAPLMIFVSSLALWISVLLVGY